MKKPTKPIKPKKSRFDHTFPIKRDKIYFSYFICEEKCNEDDCKLICPFNCCEDLTCEYKEDYSLQDIINKIPPEISYQEIKISVEEFGFSFVYEKKESQLKKEIELYNKLKNEYELNIKNININENIKYKEEMKKYKILLLEYNIWKKNQKLKALQEGK